jgi:hypothetical protein
MAVVQKAPSSKRTIVLVGLLTIIGGVSAWMFLFKDRATPAVGGGVLPTSSAPVERIQTAVNRSFFRDARLSALRMYAKLPIEIGPVGRLNPFASIFESSESQGSE